MSGAAEPRASSAAAQTAKVARRPARSRLARLGVLIALAAMTVLASTTVPGFLSPANLTTILLHVSINAVLALGMTFVIVTAGIDLSVGSIVALAGVLAAKTLTSAPLLGAIGPIGGGSTCLASTSSTTLWSSPAKVTSVPAGSKPSAEAAMVCFPTPKSSGAAIGALPISLPSTRTLAPLGKPRISRVAMRALWRAISCATWASRAGGISLPPSVR